MKKIAMRIVAMMIVAVGALAELPAPYAGWAEGPARYLMTKAEKDQWQKIDSADQAKAFVDLFWARRDPTPATPQNEVRAEFDRRVEGADLQFTTTKSKGSMTDRGHVLILLGPPYQVSGRGNTGRTEGMSMTPGTTASGGLAVQSPTSTAANQLWKYAQDKKPAFIKQKELEIVFADEMGGGQFTFARSHRVNPDVILRTAADLLIVSPNLTAAPVFTTAAPIAVPPSRVTSFKNASLKEAYDRFRTAGKTTDGSAHLTWGEYVTPEGQGFVPVSLYIPASASIPAGKTVTFFGVVENAAGEVVEVYEEEATLTASGRDAYVDKSLSLQPGKYTATFGVSSDGLLALAKADVTVEGLNPADPAISQLLLSNNAFPLPQAQKKTDPFAFGGFKVVPKGDALFSTADELWYFLELRNPGLSDTGAPKMMVKLDITGKTDEQKSVSLNFPIQEVETMALKGVPNHFGLVQAFPLSDFKPGDYKVEIKVIDYVLKKNYLVEKEFQVGKM